jgi:large repetitive protein
VTCSAATTVTQTDLDTGAITSSATASGGGVTSAAVAATVTASQTKALSLGRTASPTSYGAVGDTINLSYAITNVGNVTLGPAQFTIADTKAVGGTPFGCGASTSLAPGAAVSCSAVYTVMQADLDAGSLTSSASASGGGASSAAVTITLQKTTATTPPTTKTSTFTGSVSSKRQKKFTLTVGDGSTANALQFSASGKNKTSSSLTLKVLAANGSVVAQTSGPSVVQLTTPALARGTYTWEVSGSTSASFTLQVTYAAP